MTRGPMAHSSPAPPRVAIRIGAGRGGVGGGEAGGDARAVSLTAAVIQGNSSARPAPLRIDPAPPRPAPPHLARLYPGVSIVPCRGCVY